MFIDDFVDRDIFSPNVKRGFQSQSRRLEMLLSLSFGPKSDPSRNGQRLEAEISYVEAIDQSAKWQSKWRLFLTFSAGNEKSYNKIKLASFRGWLLKQSRRL